MRNLKKLLNDESGVTAIEYGLIAALVGVAAIGAMKILGGGISNTFNRVTGQLDSAGSASR